MLSHTRRLASCKKQCVHCTVTEKPLKPWAWQTSYPFDKKKCG